MTTVTQLSKTLQALLTTTANDLARTTGFTQRQSKVTGAVFAQATVLGWLTNAEATLEELTQGMAALDVTLSPQGLEHRFDQRAAELLKQLLQRATQELITVDALMAMEADPGGNAVVKSIYSYNNFEKTDYNTYYAPFAETLKKAGVDVTTLVKQ